MASTGNTVSIGFKIEEGAGGLKNLVMDANALRSVMEQNVKSAQKFEKKIFETAAATATISYAVDAVQSLGTAMDSFFAESNQFSTAMRGANTMAQKSGEDYDRLKDSIADLATTVPIARDSLANGLYQVISNGVPEDNWITYLEASARSAVGGLADINKVVGVTSTLIKNYGLEWESATDIQDKIQLTAKNGVTSFEQLADALPRVAGNAATLGVSVDELMGTFATLTGVSGNTAEVSTQLAAIFTALVKPSSEAAEMASQMGIEFNAAAIKGAGGFQNFLSELDASVKAYAQKSGTLEQEVYGRLFGSAEALRALIPLQGELADNFSSNVANMVNSAGTMDAAYAEMAQTAESKSQILKNGWAELTDTIAGLASSSQPIISFISDVLASASNITLVAKAVNGLGVSQTLAAAKTKALSATMKLVSLTSSGTARKIELLRVVSGRAAAQAVALRVALRGLMIASGIGAAIWLVTAAISAFCDATDDATDTTERLTDSTDDYKQAAAAAKVQIDKDIAELKSLMDAKKSTTEAVQRLNDSYGDLFGTFKTAEDAYKTLIRLSGQYVKQMGLQAEANALAGKIASASVDAAEARRKRGEWEKEHPDEMHLGRRDKVTGLTETFSNNTEWLQLRQQEQDALKLEEQYTQRMETVKSQLKGISTETKSTAGTTKSELKASEMSWEQLGKEIESVKKRLLAPSGSYADGEFAKLKARYKELDAEKSRREKRSGTSKTSSRGKKTLVADPKTREELQNNIDIYTKKLTAEDTAEQRSIRSKITAWSKAVEAIDRARAEAERPATLDTLGDIDKEIAYQRSLRSTANSETLAGIDKEIERLEALKASMEQAAYTPMAVEDIKTIEQLNRELSYYNTLLDKADAAQRSTIKSHINELEKLRKSWDDTLDTLDRPGEISTLDNIDAISEAVSYYQARQKKASGDEVRGIQMVIEALKRKQNALQRGIDIPSMVTEADEINRLTGRDYKLKIRGMGFDELTDKIKELRRMLADTDNPLSPALREDVEGLISTYSRWRKEGVDTFGTMREGWNSLRSMGDTVGSLTDVIERNGNAWEKITGIVDGFLQLYDGIRSIVSIINLLSAATEVHTGKTVEEAAATVASTAATTAETQAVLANTAAKSGEAVAEAVKSGAKLPFPANIAAIAAAVAAVVSALSIVGSFAAGGIVGGASPTGDKLLARVNSGEMILNQAQQRRLFNLLNAPTMIKGMTIPQSRTAELKFDAGQLKAVIGSSNPAGGGVVKFKIDGRTLVGVLERENNVRKRN